MRETLHVNYDGNQMTFREEDCYESRGKSTIRLISQAFDSMPESKKNQIKPFSVFFYLGDRSFYPFSYSASSYNDRIIPCHVFACWKECGIEDYEEICSELMSRASHEHIDDRLFWIGNVNTHQTRKIFVEMTSERLDVCAIDSGNWHGKDGSLKKVEKKYISIPDHSNYRYLIDIQGNGYSGRTKLLMHTGRPLFYQSRMWHEYWFFQTEPFIHYIPVKEDLSDLNEKIDWANSHPKECATIAANALAFAKNNLRRENAIKRYQDILILLGEN